MSGKKRRKGETGSILWPFQSCVLKQNKKKIQDELEGGQPNAVISWSLGTHQEITGQLV